MARHKFSYAAQAAHRSCEDDAGTTAPVAHTKVTRTAAVENPWLNSLTTQVAMLVDFTRARHCFKFTEFALHVRI
jgi:dihydrodipicolinate reductase